MKRAILLLSLGMVSRLACADLLVTDLVGKAEYEGKGNIQLLSEIAAGGQFRLLENARMTAIDVATGKEFMLRGPGQYAAEKSGLRVLKGAPLETKTLPVTNLPSVKVAGGRLSQIALVMRNVTRTNIPVPLSPVNTAVLTKTPLLRWSAVEGANAYHLSIAEDGGAQVFASTTERTELQLTTSAKLLPGTHYVWRIEAVGANGQFAEAATRFSVISEPQSRLLAMLRPSDGDGHGRRVLYAVQLQEAGAVEEAKSVWKSLAKERPEDELIRAMSE